MSLVMSKPEREAFLSEVHVAIISIPEADRGPFSVPVWYIYDPLGEFLVWTGGNSRKGILLQKANRISVCVQQETMPYRYVSAEGHVISTNPIKLDQELRPLIYRYLGEEAGDQFIEQLGGDQAGTGDILIRMKPERWLSEDYSKQDSW